MTRLLASLAVALLPLLSASAVQAAGSGPKPVLDAGKGEHCVMDTAWMRRNHMELLKHQRDDSVRLGARKPQHSLQGCIDCHASASNGSVTGGNQNFCQGCHTYAAAALDCWDCHTSKPGGRAAASVRKEALK